MMTSRRLCIITVDIFLMKLAKETRDRLSTTRARRILDIIVCGKIVSIYFVSCG